MGGNGFEPLTRGFSSPYSTPELSAWAGDGRNRTGSKRMQNAYVTITPHPGCIKKSLPAIGVEPILPKELDFKSSASAIPPSGLCLAKAIQDNKLGNQPKSIYY